MIGIEDLYPQFGTALFVSSAVICCFTFYILKRISDVTVPVRDSTKTHNWMTIKLSSKPWHCSICESLLLNGIGVYCDCCGVCADPDCIKKANSQLKCKSVNNNNENHVHHWVKGNLPLGAVCFICKDDCSLELGLIDYQCCWCQRTIHTKCQKFLKDQLCDFGPFRSMIVPPFCVQTARRKGTLNKYLLRNVRDPGWNDWSPLIVVANKKSGNGDGALILSEFRKFLNPIQVIDLAERRPTAALQWCVLLAPKVVRILVGGGDGTISWVLTSSHKLDLNPQPPLSIIPLGTGNDLSRVLGWGKANPPELDVSDVLKNIESSKQELLDRWKLEITSSRHLGLRIPSKLLYMYNYCSIGVDAQVALNFHKTRDSAYYMFGSRLFNKMLYLCFGTHQVVTSDCKNLEKQIELFLDGKQIELPELESIVILNISSWGAGVDLWAMCNDSGRNSQSHHDGILEVVGIYSSFHIAQLQIGLSTPLKLGQARTVEIRLTGKAPIQVDGEPWEQNTCYIRISYVNKCPVLVNKSDS